MAKKLLFLILLVTPSFGWSITLSDIRTEIRTRIKDTDATRRRYSDTQLLNMINQTQRDVVNVSWILKTNSSIALVSGTTFYTLPTNMIAIHRVSLDYKNLPETTLQELDSRFNGGSWPLTTGKPDRYFQDPGQSSKIGVYPFPSTTTQLGTLQLIYFNQATDLSADSDKPFNGEDRYLPYDDLLIYEPCYKIFMIEGELQKAGEYRGYYETRIQVLLGAVSNKPNYLPGFSAQRK